MTWLVEQCAPGILLSVSDHAGIANVSCHAWPSKKISYLFVHICICVFVCVSTRVHTSEGVEDKRDVRVLLHYSPPVPLRRVFSLNLELKCSWIDSKLVNPRDSPVSASFETDA